MQGDGVDATVKMSAPDKAFCLTTYREAGGGGLTSAPNKAIA